MADSHKYQIRVDVATRYVPVRRAGVYVPGGLAAYPSSAVMAIVPAQVAGVPAIAACSPPGLSGAPHGAALAVCAMLGVEEVYAVGGAQAVAALAYGVEGIERVDKIVGPGNLFVALAKREEEIYRPGDAEPIRLSRHSAALRLLQYVRDEAHRFAQHYHHQLRRKALIE